MKMKKVKAVELEIEVLLDDRWRSATCEWRKLVVYNRDTALSGLVF
jgi:hypothetical protein